VLRDVERWRLRGVHGGATWPSTDRYFEDGRALLAELRRSLRDTQR
jgi:hypothetical protein